MSENMIRRSSGSIDYEGRVWGKRGSIGTRDLAWIRIEFAAEDIVLDADSFVLEVGCGTGDLLRTMLMQQKSGCRAYGVDINLASLEWGSTQDEITRYFQGDVLELPLAGEAFDVILGFDIFEHLPDLDTALEEIHRCLKRDGVFHCFIPCDVNFWTLHRFLWKHANFNLKETLGGHIQKLTSEEVVGSVHSHGFRIVRKRFSYHFIGQIKDILDYVWRYLTDNYLSFPDHRVKTEMQYRLPFIKYHPLQQLFWLAALARCVGFTFRLLEFLAYHESRLFRNLRGAGIHLTCTRVEKT